MENVGLHILWPFGIFCEHSVYFVAIWYILGTVILYIVLAYRFGML
jgi:hypothetical protein